MKVLFQSYNTCCQNESGGVQVRIRKIQDLLFEKGVQVDYFNQFTTKLEDYDVLHVFKLNTENTPLIQCAKQKGLKVVLSSIVNLMGGNKIDLARFLTKFHIPTIYSLVSKSLQLCDSIIVETPREGEFICKHYKIGDNKIEVIPNGVHIPKVATDSIFEKIGERCEYILQVGLFDQNKNQMNVIRALRDSNYHVVFVGGETTFAHSDYYQQCVREARDRSNIHFLGWLKPDSDMLASAYQHAHVLVLPSFQETFGMVALEGAVSGCHVCMSNTLPILDFGIFDNSLTFNPNSIVEIREVLDIAMKKTKDDDLKKKSIARFNWSSIIDQHIQCYSK